MGIRQWANPNNESASELVRAFVYDMIHFTAFLKRAYYGLITFQKHGFHATQEDFDRIRHQ